MAFDLSDWEPLQEIITKTRMITRPLIDKHRNSTDHDEPRQTEEIIWFLENLHFITHKWNVDILYQLELHDGLIFNDLRRHLGGISARTLSDRLKELQEFQLVNRTLLDTRPPSVMYTLSDEGKGFVELSMVLILYLAKHRKK